MHGCRQPRTLEQQLKEAREADGSMMEGQRGSRVNKWIERSEHIRKDSGAATPETIASLDVGEYGWNMDEHGG